MVGIGSAPGKVILSGEHSVVYGYPAIASALGIRCVVTSKESEQGLKIVANNLGTEAYYTPSQLSSLDEHTSIHPGFDNIALSVKLALSGHEPALEIAIDSDIPIGAGLGSSAAVCVASVCAVADLLDLKLDPERISAYAFRGETIAHGTPSGIDNSVATYGGLLVYENGKIEQKEMKTDIPIVIVNTKIPRNTRALVNRVRERRNRFPGLIDSILQTMGNLTRQVDLAIQNNEIGTLSELFTINHNLLDALGVGHTELSSIYWQAKSAGYDGVKLTGAGGGGCMILVSKEESDPSFLASLQDRGMEVISTSLSPLGAKIGE